LRFWSLFEVIRVYFTVTAFWGNLLRSYCFRLGLHTMYRLHLQLKPQFRQLRHDHSLGLCIRYRLGLHLQWKPQLRHDMTITASWLRENVFCANTIRIVQTRIHLIGIYNICFSNIGWTMMTWCRLNSVKLCKFSGCLIISFDCYFSVKLWEFVLLSAAVTHFISPSH
jgi:hypothetical protein